MERHHNYIAGKWVPPETADYYQSHNPACPSQVLGEFPRSGSVDVDAAVASAETARAIWNQTQAPQRAAILLRFSQLLLDAKTELARIITLEQGKALCESTGEVARAAAEAAFAAGEAVRLSGQTFPSERFLVLYRSAAGWRAGSHNTLELSDCKSGAKNRSGIGLRQHRCVETGLADTPVCGISHKPP